mmetsp:Transcript_25879/g.29602  ORF Transcript_25879/g.29602 Transcript_25879/m.29602 type:complete len:192 (-) Transcript_25879:91-666(-)
MILPAIIIVAINISSSFAFHPIIANSLKFHLNPTRDRGRTILSSQVRFMSSEGSSEGGTSGCVPCSGLTSSNILSSEQIQKEIKDTLWKFEEQNGIACICLSYTAKNFQAAMDSLNAVGVIAEREAHHPDLHLSNYREVEIVLWTHKLGGVTNNDIQLAKMLDSEIKILYSPKWLKENPLASESSISEEKK